MKVIINGTELQTGGGKTYIAGQGITINDDIINVTNPVEGVTQAEYDALTEEDKKDKLFIITDAESSGGGSGGGLTQEEADARYLQLNGGEMMGLLTINDELTTVAPSLFQDTVTIHKEGFLSFPDGMSIEGRQTSIQTGNGTFIEESDDAGLTYPADISNNVEIMYFNSPYIQAEGDFSVAGHWIRAVRTPWKPSDAANKQYVDNSLEDLRRAKVPVGTIVMWAGSANDIPEGWVLCNGMYGAPDLRDRFIVGAGRTYIVGEEGGEATHTLTIDEIPSHTHQIITYTASTSGNVNAMQYGKGTGSSIQLNSQKTGNNEAHNNLPPYYALCYIMRVASPIGVEITWTGDANNRPTNLTIQVLNEGAVYETVDLGKGTSQGWSYICEVQQGIINPKTGWYFVIANSNYMEILTIDEGIMKYILSEGEPEPDPDPEPDIPEEIDP